MTETKEEDMTREPGAFANVCAKIEGGIGGKRHFDKLDRETQDNLNRTRDEYDLTMQLFLPGMAPEKVDDKKETP